MRPNDPSIEAQLKRAQQDLRRLSERYDLMAARYHYMKYAYLLLACLFFGLLFFGD